MIHIVHAAIFEAGVVVYGGFVRDYIVRNESANDVDVNTTDYDATEKCITATLKKLDIIQQDPRVKPWGKDQQYHRVTYIWQGHKLEVDLVHPDKVPYSPPGVDCDVGNLALDKKHGLTLKKRALERIVPLRECIAHAQAKEFVFFYELGSNASQKMAVERLTKYLGRGWTCRAHISAEVRSMIPSVPLSLLRPDAAYSEENLARARRPNPGELP